MLWALSKVFPKTEEISFPSAGFGPEQLTLTEENRVFVGLRLARIKTPIILKNTYEKSGAILRLV